MILLIFILFLFLENSLDLLNVFDFIILIFKFLLKLSNFLLQQSYLFLLFVDQRLFILVVLNRFLNLLLKLILDN